MPFLYELALVATISVASWIALDIALDRGRRRLLACVALVAVAALAWALGELLLLHADAPGQVLAARRILFAGVCLLPPAWLWCALVAAHPEARRSTRLALALLSLPFALAYACLYLAPGGLFVDWYARPPRHGPLFLAIAGLSWLMIAVGAGILLRETRRRAAGPSFARELAIGAAALVPLLANAAYVLGHVTGFDPTPVSLGFSAVVFRVLVVDLTWAAHHPPFARAEVVAQMRDAVLVADPSGRVVDWNHAAPEVLRNARIGGRSLREILAEALRMRGRELEVREFPLERHGQLFATAAVIADRTEMRRAELRHEMATRLEALGYLASGVAHEFNNPLTYVTADLALLEPLFAELAEGARAALPAPLRALSDEGLVLLAEAREGADRIQRIVEKLRRFSPTSNSSEPSGPIALRPAIERAAAMAVFGKREREIPITADVPLPAAEAAESDVIHIVFHLLLNAMQMGGENVPIAIDVRACEGEIAVCVADEGPGIGEGDLPHLFEPFYTTRRPSVHVGLGLSLCWELARRNGGRLDAENRAAGGAAFTLWLPAAGAAPGSIGAAPA